MLISFPKRIVKSLLTYHFLMLNFLILNLLSFISKLVSKFTALLFELKFNNGISISPLKPPSNANCFLLGEKT